VEVFAMVQVSQKSVQPVPFVSDTISIPSQSAMFTAPGMALTMSLPKEDIAVSSSLLHNLFVQSGNKHRAVPLTITMNSTYVQGVIRTHMEWIHALVQKRLKAGC